MGFIARIPFFKCNWHQWTLIEDQRIAFLQELIKCLKLAIIFTGITYSVFFLNFGQLPYWIVSASTYLELQLGQGKLFWSVWPGTCGLWPLASHSHFPRKWKYELPSGGAERWSNPSNDTKKYVVDSYNTLLWARLVFGLALFIASALEVITTKRSVAVTTATATPASRNFLALPAAAIPILLKQLRELCNNKTTPPCAFVLLHRPRRDW